MNHNYAIFDDIGTALETRQSRTVITPTATSPVSLATVARAAFPKASGRWYFTMLCWGDEALAARIGIATADAGKATALGGDANGYGLDTDGKVYNNGTGTDTGATFGKGDEIGVLLDITTASPFVQWFVNGTSVYTQDLTDVGPWYIAASIACTVDYGVQLFLNSGQRKFENAPTGCEDGWYAPIVATQGARLADTSVLLAPDDDSPNLRYHDALRDGTQTVGYRALSFWPWGDQVNSGAMTIECVNDGSLTPMLKGSPRDMAVTVRKYDDGKTPLYTAVVDSISADSDGLCTITCRDPLALLQVPLQRWMIRPDRDPDSANTPRPILLGACRNVPIKSIDALNNVYACADQPMMGIGFCRVAGYPLDPAAADFTLNGDKIDITLAAGADGVVTLDASSVGGQQLPDVTKDIYGGVGAPFTGADGSAPTGWDDVGGGIDASAPVMNGGVLEFPLVQPSSTVYAEVPIYLSGVTGSVYLLMDWLDDSGSVVASVQSPSVTGTQAYTNSEVIDTAPSNAASARLRVMTSGHTAGIVRVGAVQASYVRYGDHTAIGLTNPGFEDGMTGWSSNDSDWTILSGFGFAGSKSVKYNLGAGSRLSNAGVAPISAPNSRIVANCRISLDGRGGHPYGALRITWLDSGNNEISSSRSNSIEHSNGGAWQQCSVTGMSPAGATYAEIQLEAGNGNGNLAGAIFDAVAWDFVLEPTGGQRTSANLGDFTNAAVWQCGAGWALYPAGANGPGGAAYAEHAAGADGALTALRLVSVTLAASYAGWAGISAAKIGGGKSYLVRVTIPSMPEDGQHWVALSTTKDLTGALAAWNIAGTYQVVVKSPSASAQPLWLVSVDMSGLGVTPTPPTVSSVEVNEYDDTYTPDPRSTAPADLQPIKFRDYVQAVLDKHKTGIAWDNDSATAIDTDSGYRGVGVFMDSGETIGDALDTALAGYTACKWCGADGSMRFTRMIDPASAASVGTIDENAMLSDLVPSQDTAKALSTRMGARRNWKQFADGDLVAPSTNFPPAVRQYLLSPYQQVMASAKAIAPAYIHARYADPAPSAFDNQGDAQTEIDRVCAIYETQRWFYSTEVALDGVSGLDLGQIWRLVYPLYGLESGKNVMVVTYQPDFVNNTAQITLWG